MFDQENIIIFQQDQKEMNKKRLQFKSINEINEEVDKEIESSQIYKQRQLKNMIINIDLSKLKQFRLLNLYSLRQNKIELKQITEFNNRFKQCLFKLIFYIFKFPSGNLS